MDNFLFDMTDEDYGPIAIHCSPSRILHGDCLDVMREMETDSVDLVFCSSPYEAARTYGGKQT
jgi:hypothetical protein